MLACVTFATSAEALSYELMADVPYLHGDVPDETLQDKSASSLLMVKALHHFLSPFPSVAGLPKGARMQCEKAWQVKPAIAVTFMSSVHGFGTQKVPLQQRYIVTGQGPLTALVRKKRTKLRWGLLQSINSIVHTSIH